ncbi:uncharacterized protein [Paramisgurnus dabryanus]|uniref:uncharacterized protein isoform X3 n=1 Tax=Paramisgurnus dabryanus TaxID=90735 RepID=UPI0031F40E4A
MYLKLTETMFFKKHITIQEGRAIPELQRCTTCCKDFHCPFCSSSLFHPTKLSKVKYHLESHFKRAVLHEGYTIHRCGLDCRPKWHYHCIHCNSMLIRRQDFMKHLSFCKGKHPDTSTTIPALATSAIPAPASSAIPAPATSAITAPATSAIPAPAISAIPAPATSAIPAPASSAIPAPPTSAITAPATSAIPSLATSAIPAPAISAIPAPATSAIPAPTTSAIQAPTTSAILASTTFTVPATPSKQIQRVSVKQVLRKNCPICQLSMNRTNLKRHIERKHTGKHKDITASSHLPSECIDPENGVYSVHKSFHGATTPLHVQNKVWGENQNVFCESAECQVNMELAWRSGLKAHQCVHLKSLTYCTSYVSSPVLSEETLNEMVNSRWFGEDKKKVCLDLQNLANANHLPLSVYSQIGIPQSKKYISVFEPTVSYYSRLGRVMVSYDTKKNSWHCPCARTKRSCQHKYIAKWHLFQTHRELFRKVRCTEEVEFPTSTEDGDSHDEVELGNIPYPPKDGQKFKALVEYILKFKKLPAVLPEHLRHPLLEKEYPRHLIPLEMMCQQCPGNVPLSDPILITNKAKILTNFRIVEDCSTYCKSCHQCGTHYRYQEWKDGLHNFNDRIVLDLSLCLTIRNMIQVHTAVSRVVEYLELTTGVKFPSANTVLHGYLHFEALTDHDYNYSCVNCGDHPPVVIMDLHKKGAFHLAVSDLAQPPKDFNGEVDIELFWEALSMERISRGFVTSDLHNPLKVAPSFHFWAPWIGRSTCKSNRVLNTEFEKVRPPKPAEVCELTVSEDRLTEELYKQKVQVVRKLCRECGLDSSGSRNDLLLRLSNELKSRHTYDKVFQKIWAASGGWAVIMCPCGIVYSIKCNIRAESPRDFTDMLLSWKYLPNVVIYDFARGLATHMNLREPERLPFSPFEGRLKAPTPENIALAKEGKLKVSLPWLKCKKVVPDCDGHPITGSAEHYALYDRFHEDNTKDARDALRKLGLVPQLAGVVNSQVAEQLFAKMKKNNYYLNMALPTTHLFLMRNIIHHYNCQKNKQRLGNIKKAFDTKIAMNIHSQAVLAEAVPRTAALGTPPTAAFGTSPTMALGTPPTATFGTPPTATFGTPPTATFVTPPTATFGTPPTATFVTPPTATFVTPPTATFGTPPTATFGTPPTATFGTPPTATFVTPPTATFVTPPTATFGTPPTATFGTPPTATFGTPPTATFGTPPTATFGTPPTATFGTSPAAATDYSLTFKPYAKEWNSIQDKLLNYVLDTERPAAEIIVKEGPLCITREEFWSLGLLRDMDSHIGNACLKLIHEASQQHGKDIYIEDMFVVPTWKDTQDNITANFPEDIDMKDFLVFPCYTKANGPEHFVLCKSCSGN